MEVLTTLVKSVNKSLVPSLPLAHDEAIKQNSICYYGEYGNNDILCKDMAEGMTVTQVAHWYLSPERHVREYICVAILTLSIIIITLSRLPRYPELTTKSLRPPLFLRILTIICCTLNILYKYCGYKGKLWFLTMPCHVNWAMAFILCFYPNLSSHASNILCQIWVGMAGLTLIAILEPDLSDLTLPFEVPYFFIMHVILLIYPLYYLLSGKITLLPLPNQNESIVSCFMKWWMLTNASFAFFYVPVVTPLCIYSGLNLNYMMSPPPTPGDIIGGVNYRLISCAGVSMVFGVVRLVCTFIEFCIRYWNSCPFEFHASIHPKKVL